MWQVILLFSFLAKSNVEQTRAKSLHPLPIHPNNIRLLHCPVVPLYAAADSDDKDDESATSFPVKFNRPIPKYDELAKAVEVFDDICFYGDDVTRRDFFTKARQDVLGNMTVKEVYFKYTKGSNALENVLKDLVSEIGAFYTPILAYYKEVDLKAEDILDSLRIIALTGTQDVDIFKSSFVASLPVAKEMIRAATSDPDRKKDEKTGALNLALVLGSSGSGKTFFSLYELAPTLLRDKKKHNKAVTWHVYPSETPVRFFKNNQEEEEEDPEAAAKLCAWIKEKVSLKSKKDITDRKLQMHVCIVLDEAGDLRVRSWFENIDMLRRLCEHAETIAESVLVVVAGTALTGRQCNPKKDAYVFRMKPWTADDLGMVLSMETFLKSMLEGNETTQSIAKAIFAQPKIGALATNARSAYFLCDAIASLSRQYKSIVWRLQLNAWAMTLVTRVVERYIDANALSNLESYERRRVAASVFYALQACKMDEATLPTFLALDDRKMAVAFSLVETNIEFGQDQPKLVDGETLAFTITPAIAMILYAIAGIPTTLLPSGRAQEELAGLYAVRQCMLASMETYVDTASPRPSKEAEALGKLDQALENIQLLALQTQVQPAPDKSGQILVPIVRNSTVFVNGEKASFADVIAPYMLTQVKRKTAKKDKPVDLLKELDKCKLLKRCDDDRLLRGLMTLWRGGLDANVDMSKQTMSEQKPHRIFQKSAAFPENMLCLETPDDPCEFAVIEGSNIIVGDKTQRLLPWDKNTRIAFVLSTNADEIQLKLAPRKILRITDHHLDSNLRINPDSFLRDADRTAWINFVRDEVRERVDIKILLTKST